MDDGMDFIDQVQAGAGKPARGKKQKHFTSSTERISNDDVQQASKEDPTRRGMEPGWKRHTVVVHDDWVKLVDEMAEELSITKMDAWRHLLQLGVRDYLAGERPDLERRPRALNRIVVEVRQ